MNETVTAPQGAADPSADPAVTETPAPVDTGAATDPADPADPPKPSRVERRIAALSARLSAGEQERARLTAENEHYRRQAGPPRPAQPITENDIPRIVEERVAAQLAQRETQGRVERFHEAGRAAFPDWQDRCSSLMQMGADAAFAELLVETPDGARVAAALADDPEELERISGLKTERARAIALGRFAAGMEGKPAPAARNVSRAPAPIRPISGGTSRTEFNESTASTQQLVDHYTKQAMAARR